MAGNKLERRTFLQMFGAATIGSSISLNPFDLFAGEVDKKNNTRFKLSKPRWIIYENGSFDLISKEIILKNCRPAIDGQGVMPKNVFLGDSPKGKRIVYELPGGFLMLDLKTNKDSISIGAELSGFSKAPRWLYPISQAEIHGVNQFFKQGFGSGGQSGVYPIRPSQNSQWGNISGEQSWSYDSFMTFAFLGIDETIAIGNVEHNDFLQRSTIYNKTHRSGLSDKETSDEQVFFESAMLLEGIEIENEYIKLPELHFYAGNKPFETIQELAWKQSEQTVARQGSLTSYHWISSPTGEKPNSLDKLVQQVNFLSEMNRPLPIHTIIIDKGYCTVGDWLEPNDLWPGGLDRASREIFKEGYRAGIWIAPFIVSENSEIYRKHQGWLVKNFNDEPIPEFIEGIGICYTLDISHQGVLKYLSRLFKALRKMGFLFYYLAHLNSGFKDSVKVKKASPGETNVQNFRTAMKIIREEVGTGSLIMANESPFSPLIGFADVIQTGKEAKNGWSSDGVENIIQESYFCHYFNNVLWQNDPGVIDLFNEDSGFTEEEKISLAMWYAALGGSVGTSSDITELSMDQIDLFRFLEPSKRFRNAHLPFWPSPDEIKVAVRSYRNLRSWSVLLFNDKNETINRKYTISDLIDEDSGFVFAWKPQVPIPFGELSEITVWLKPHESRLFYISKNNEPPPENLTLGGKMPDDQDSITAD